MRAGYYLIVMLFTDDYLLMQLDDLTFKGHHGSMVKGITINLQHLAHLRNTLSGCVAPFDQTVYYVIYIAFDQKCIK